MATTSEGEGDNRLRSSLMSSMDRGSGIKQEPFRSKAILPWDRLSNWLHCVCVITFDLELGQALEVFKRTVTVCVSYV